MPPRSFLLRRCTAACCVVAPSVPPITRVCDWRKNGWRLPDLLLRYRPHAALISLSGGRALCSVRFITGVLVALATALTNPPTTYPARDWSRPAISPQEREALGLLGQSGPRVDPTLEAELREDKPAI